MSSLHPSSQGQSHQQQQQQQQSKPSNESPKAPSSTNPSSTGYRIFPSRIPAPLQRLFDRFPLVAYPANELPARCPAPSDRALPSLHVFISAEDATKGRPSFNPSCLKWQTFLRIAGVQLRVVSSTNHASPSGALPFLLPPVRPSSSPASAPAPGREPPQPQPPQPPQPPRRPPSPPTSEPSPVPIPVPASKLQAYALTHGTSPLPPAAPLPPRLAAKVDAYTALLEGPIRRAWLHALYLTPSNVPLLTSLYLRSATRSALAQRALHRQLRTAAAAELASSHNGVDQPSADLLYAEARRAFVILSELLSSVSGDTTQREGGGDEGAGREDAAPAVTGVTRSGSGSGTDWFFGRDGPALFDAAVFSYTHLLLEGSGLEWEDRSLAEIVEALPPLVAHRNRMLERLWGEEGLGESQQWVKV